MMGERGPFLGARGKPPRLAKKKASPPVALAIEKQSVAIEPAPEVPGQVPVKKLQEATAPDRLEEIVRKLSGEGTATTREATGNSSDGGWGIGVTSNNTFIHVTRIGLQNCFKSNYSGGLKNICEFEMTNMFSNIRCTRYKLTGTPSFQFGRPKQNAAAAEPAGTITYKSEIVKRKS